ncbi:MAG: hypothetical protein ACM3ZV_12860 [Bacillota bacterium]
MNEPFPPNARPCSTPHSAPVGWLRGDGPADPPQQADADALRAAIELVLAHPDAVAEILTRARPHPVRHDGWTGERMAAFLETLADTGLVTEACRAAGMSREAARQLRNRDPIFDAAYAAAASRARSVVADGLLERSITGTVEHYYRDGVLVGERRHYESWLGLAVLRRLDRQAEQDRADEALSDRIARHWRDAMDALRADGTALLKAEVDKVDIPPLPDDPRPTLDCWQDDRGVWMTTFAPPPGFAGVESCPWDGFNAYERECTDEEVALLEASMAVEDASDRAQEDARRELYFSMLRKEIARIPNLDQAACAKIN